MSRMKLPRVSVSYYFDFVIKKLEKKQDVMMEYHFLKLSMGPVILQISKTITVRFYVAT